MEITQDFNRFNEKNRELTSLVKKLKVIDKHFTLDSLNKDFGNTHIDVFNYYLDKIGNNIKDTLILKYPKEINDSFKIELSNCYKNDENEYHNKKFKESMGNNFYEMDENYSYTYLLENYTDLYDYIIKKKFIILPLAFDRHGTTVVYQTIENLIYFKIFNTGTGIINHEKYNDKYLAYYDIIFDINNEKEKNLLIILINIIYLLDGQNNSLDFNYHKTYTYKDLYEKLIEIKQIIIEEKYDYNKKYINDITKTLFDDHINKINEIIGEEETFKKPDILKKVYYYKDIINGLFFLDDKKGLMDKHEDLIYEKFSFNIPTNDSDGLYPDNTVLRAFRNDLIKIKENEFEIYIETFNNSKNKISYDERPSIEFEDILTIDNEKIKFSVN